MKIAEKHRIIEEKPIRFTIHNYDANTTIFALFFIYVHCIHGGIAVFIPFSDFLSTCFLCVFSCEFRLWEMFTIYMIPYGRNASYWWINMSIWMKLYLWAIIFAQFMQHFYCSPTTTQQNEKQDEKWLSNAYIQYEYPTNIYVAHCFVLVHMQICCDDIMLIEHQ